MRLHHRPHPHRALRSSALAEPRRPVGPRRCVTSIFAAATPCRAQPATGVFCSGSIPASRFLHPQRARGLPGSVSTSEGRQVVCLASRSNPMRAIQKELGMQSTKLPADIRERVERAMEVLNYRATVGDVAAKAGIKLSEAEEALKALAYDCLGALEVSEAGEVLYVFPRDFRLAIRGKSLQLRAEPVVKRVQTGAWWMVRVAFSSALVSSVVLVTLAIVAILSGGGDKEDENDRRRSSSGGGVSMHLLLNVSDIFYCFDPFYYRSYRQGRGARQMGFLEAVFSFVFGDGDPNSGLEEQRWSALGRCIQSKGGVVTAEEMAPFLDPPSPSSDPAPGGAAYEDESFVLPALLRLGGEPVVDEEGQLLYRFEKLQVAAQNRLWVGRFPALVQEAEYKLTAASIGQRATAVALGIANVVGVVTLSSMLADPDKKVKLLQQGFGYVPGLMPYLQVYAAAFFGIPLLRSVYNSIKNAAIGARNLARQQAAELLTSPSAGLRKKMQSARDKAKQQVVTSRDVVYSTEREVDEQLAGRDLEAFDRRLGRSEDRGE